MHLIHFMYFSILLIFSMSISCKSDHATSRFTHNELDVVNVVEELLIFQHLIGMIMQPRKIIWKTMELTKST